jgi:hypothetical protein
MLFCSEVDLVPSLIREKDALLRFAVFVRDQHGHAREQWAEELDRAYVFSSTPNNGRRTSQAACSFCATAGSRAALVASRSALVNDIEMKVGGKQEVRNGSLNMPEMRWT